MEGWKMDGGNREGGETMDGCRDEGRKGIGKKERRKIKQTCSYVK